MSAAVTDTFFSDLTLVSRGKVRDVYATSDPDALLFVATDRISAYDVILKNVCLLAGLVEARADHDLGMMNAAYFHHRHHLELLRVFLTRAASSRHFRSSGSTV